MIREKAAMNRKTSRDLDLGGVFLCINARPSFAGGQARRGCAVPHAMAEQQSVSGSQIRRSRMKAAPDPSAGFIRAFSAAARYGAAYADEGSPCSQSFHEARRKRHYGVRPSPARRPPFRKGAAEWSGHKIVSLFRKIFDARIPALCYTEEKSSAARTAFPERAPKAENPAPERPS